MTPRCITGLAISLCVLAGCHAGSSAYPYIDFAETGHVDMATTHQIANPDMAVSDLNANVDMVQPDLAHAADLATPDDATPAGD